MVPSTFCWICFFLVELRSKISVRNNCGNAPEVICSKHPWGYWIKNCILPLKFIGGRVENSTCALVVPAIPKVLRAVDLDSLGATTKSSIWVVTGLGFTTSIGRSKDT